VKDLVRARLAELNQPRSGCRKVARGKRPQVAPPLDQVKKGFPRPEGAQQTTDSSSRQCSSPAKAGAGIKEGRDPRVTLAALANPGLLSVVAPRLVDADIRIELMLASLSFF
jgi:hypothetical protein